MDFLFNRKNLESIILTANDGFFEYFEQRHAVILLVIT